MADPTLLSRCGVAGGGTAPGAFAISSPTSERVRARKREKNTERDVIQWVFSFTSNQPHATLLFFHLFIFFPSFVLLSAFLPHKSANTTQSQTHQWVHARHSFFPAALSSVWQNADSSEAFQVALETSSWRPPHVHTPILPFYPSYHHLYWVAYGGLCQNEQYRKGNSYVSSWSVPSCCALVLTGDVGGVADRRGW